MMITVVGLLLVFLFQYIVPAGCCSPGGSACCADSYALLHLLLLLLQALLLHNQVIKHAVYDQVGYVLEQEGDSFTVSFYEPEDAVAFTLQVRREVHSEFLHKGP
jgi:hypothetical protein